jgi:hypothetical protein
LKASGAANMAEEHQDVRQEKRAETIVRGPQTGSPRSKAITDDEHLEQPAGLLDQFYSTLEVTYQVALRQTPPDERPVLELIDNVFAAPRTWRAAYQIEQLLSLVLTEAQLDIELKRRMAEAADLGLPYAKMLQELSGNTPEELAKTPTIKKRAVLHRLLNDLQWFYAQRFQRRLAAETLAYRVSRLFLYVFIAFFLILFMHFISQPALDRKPDQRPAPKEEIKPPKPSESGS